MIHDALSAARTEVEPIQTPHVRWKRMVLHEVPSGAFSRVELTKWRSHPGLVVVCRAGNRGLSLCVVRRLRTVRNSRTFMLRDQHLQQAGFLTAHARPALADRSQGFKIDLTGRGQSAAGREENKTRRHGNEDSGEVCWALR